jgi:hypothetical protein
LHALESKAVKTARIIVALFDTRLKPGCIPLCGCKLYGCSDFAEKGARIFLSCTPPRVQTSNNQLRRMTAEGLKLRAWQMTVRRVK